MGDVFSWLGFDFMRRAFYAVLIISPLFGLLGTMIVNRKMAFFSDALGHSALTGVAIGVIFGMNDTNLAMIFFAIAFALLLNYINRQQFASTDTVISVFSSCSVAIGLAILSRGGNFGQYSNLLVGDILSISNNELIYLILILIVALIFWLLCFNALQAIGMNVSLAKSRNIRVNLIEDLFAVLVALVVMLSIKWVGILIINALLILPAAAARNLAVNIREYHFFAALFSIFSGLVGLMGSYYAGVATGPAIVIVAAIIYFATYIRRNHV